MTSRDFCFWLRGYLDSIGAFANNADIKAIQNKLAEIQAYEHLGPGFPWVRTNTTDTILNPVPPGITVT
jgi:hypothetical protein